MEVFSQMSCQAFGLLASFSNKTMLPYLHYGKKLQAGHVIPPDPDPSPIHQHWDIRNQLVHDFYSIYYMNFIPLPELDCQLVEQWQCIPQGVGSGGGGYKVHPGFF